MFAYRWLYAFALASSIARMGRTNEGQEVLPSPTFSQNEAETFLNIQTRLRRDLIRSLNDIRGKITQFEKFCDVIGRIIRGLKTRGLDPFDSFKNGGSRMADLIFNLQGEIAISEWNSLLQTIPEVPPPPNGLLESLQTRKTDSPLAHFVLFGIQKNRIKLNRRLLQDVLYNYPFKEYSGELGVIVDNVDEILAGSSVDFGGFQPQPKAARPGEILSDILTHVLKQAEPSLAYQLHLLLANAHLVDVTYLHRLFDLMQQDDYPPDILRAKNDLSDGVKNNRTGLDLSAMVEKVKGHPPMEQLLMLVARLSSLPLGSPFFRAARAVYPHVKLRFLSNEGKFFLPRTLSDVEFLFDSFSTVPNFMNAVLVDEIIKILSKFDWEKFLENFEFFRYSKPRPLVVEMLRELLNHPNLPSCGVLMFSYFIRNNQQRVPSDNPTGIMEKPTKTQPSDILIDSEVPRLMIGGSLRKKMKVYGTTTQPSTSIPVVATPPAVVLTTFPSLAAPFSLSSPHLLPTFALNSSESTPLYNTSSPTIPASFLNLKDDTPTVSSSDAAIVSTAPLLSSTSSELPSEGQLSTVTANTSATPFLVSLLPAQKSLPTQDSSDWSSSFPLDELSTSTEQQSIPPTANTTEQYEN